jgi:nitrogen-specific signal transduction histidine kinase
MNMLVFASPLHDAEGNTAGSVCIFSDITEQRALEEQLRQAQKMEAIGRLAGGVAHDFNNILTAIQGYATLLQDEVGEESNARSDVDGILDAAARAAAFTRQLLAFNRKQVTQPDLVDANELLSSMLSMLGRVIGTSYELRFDPSPDIRPVFADRGQIGQVLMNLVVNARDAMDGGGTIVLRTERALAKPDNRVRADGDEMPGPYTVFHVRDHGHGIPHDKINRIFEPFFTTKDAMKGTGLGLSTVYGIVTQHGGFLCVDTSPAGTEFSVYLPERDEAMQARPEQAAATASRNEAVATIILVEDDKGIRDLLMRALARAGFRVLPVDDGERALDLLRRNADTSIIVSDLMLPGMTGAELMQHVRGTHPHVRTVLMSGYSSHDLALSPDVVFVEKPFTPDDLISAIRGIIPPQSRNEKTGADGRG